MMSQPRMKFFCLAALLLFLAFPSAGQNTKGDKPAQSRESRFRKTDSKQKVKKKKQKQKKVSVTTRRKGAKPSAKPGGEQAGKSIGPLRTKQPGRDDTPARSRPFSRRINVRSPSERSSNVYPQRGPYVNNSSSSPSGDDRRPISNKKIRARIRVQSARSRPDNIFPQHGRFVNNPSPVPRAHPQPVSNRPALTRLKRLQGPDRKPGKKTRVVTRSASRSYTARRSINIQASYPRGKRKTEKAYTKDISGRRLRTKNYETPGREVIPSQGGTKKFSRTGKIKQGNADRQRYGRFSNFSSGRNKPRPGKRKIVPRSISSSARKIFPQRGRYVSNPSPTPRPTENASSNAVAKRRLRRLQTKLPAEGARKLVISPKSASRSFIARKSINMWANFPRPKKKGERAVTRDLAGKKLRTRNYESPPRPVIAPTFKPYFGRKRVGDRPYEGPAGGYSSATRTRQRAWRGDIAGRRIRGIKTPREDTPGKIGPGGYKTATGRSEKRAGKMPLPVKQPGLGAAGMSAYRGFSKRRGGFVDQGEEFTGNIKSKRSLKGGGSVSGRGWNNKGIPIAVRKPPGRAAEVDGYPGKMKMFSGQPGFVDQGEEYTGSIKARRPLKGGGSVSGRKFNNLGNPIPVREPGKSYKSIVKFQGHSKARRPLKGGGSISGKLWNNRETPVQVRAPGAGYDRIGDFQGNVKARRPLKGGGSVSGKLWNNREAPIIVKAPGAGYDRIGDFQGNVKARRPSKGGGSVSGKLWNNDEKPVLVRTPSGGAAKINYSGTSRLPWIRKAYVKNPNTAEAALRKHRPEKGTYEAGDLQTKVKRHNYVHNRSSNSDANRVREPGRAFARAGDFQGNIKMQKFKLFERNRELHPDARFVKTNRNNVAEEKDALTNLKLWWARLFRKNETQPEHLKDKGKRPRYDKREEGLWYE